MQTGTEIARPRGRPPGFDRDVVLRAALQRFRTYGFAATSLDELADATGLARPSLYAAFGDKRSLYLAALARTHDWLTESFRQLREADRPMPRMLRAVFRAGIDTYLTGEVGPSGCIAVNTAATEAVTDPDIRAALARILELEDREIEAALRQAGSPTPRAHANVVTAVLHSLSVRARAGESREALERIAQDCTDLIVAASAVDSPPPPA
ncbi:TetR/AcrR family transcriptional regulator [Sphingomonas sp. LB-2]|uniref:TetR/AcrR family transcriptional regulator n=1 Tax=Sphingomonas caeni TaxID=2984949 RepID=UPI00223121B6|nr:TetR/AcrR family transcriptional regulator [Sphingomonas caeni]MCW3846548.1 TetR/AcrR family transcriptional regulator [Sphingomonas caeni]